MMVRNFLLCSDNNYWRHLLVTACSIFETQKEQIVIHVFENAVSDSNIKALEDLAKMYSAEVKIYDVSDIDSRLRESGFEVNKEISVNAYLRLFALSYIRDLENRLLYLDTDVIVKEDLNDLFNIEMNNHPIAAVKSTIDKNENNLQGPEYDHVNSGVLLMDMKKMREMNATQLFLRVIADRKGKLPWHDGTVLNDAFAGNIQFIPLKYNAVTPIFFMNYRRFMKFYNLKQWYSEEEYNEAVVTPCIVHMVGWIVGRPWTKGNKHPFKAEYWDYAKKICAGGGIPVEYICEGNQDKLRTVLHILYHKWCPMEIVDLIRVKKS